MTTNGQSVLFITMIKKHHSLNRLYLFIIVLFLFLSCKKKENDFYSNGKIKSEYYLNSDGERDGSYKEYYPNGKLKINHLYENGVLKDSSVYFDDSGNLVQIYYHKAGIDYCKVYKNYKLNLISHEGFLKNGMKINKWKYYDGHKVSKVFEYLNICNSQYTNQGWCYDGNGNLTDKGSNYFSFKIKNSRVRIGEKIVVEAFYKPALSKNSKVFICMSPKLDNKFCNIDKIKLDTVLSINNKFKYDLVFKKEGTKNLRGFFNEVFFDKENNKTGIRKVFFTFSLVVVKN